MGGGAKHGLLESSVKIQYEHIYLEVAGDEYLLLFWDTKVQTYFEVMYDGDQNSCNTYDKNVLRNFKTEIGKMQIMYYLLFSVEIWSICLIS